VTEDDITENAITLVFSRTGKSYNQKMIYPENTITGKWYNRKILLLENAITNISSSKHTKNPGKTKKVVFKKN
jgi:hypothetical protein